MQRVIAVGVACGDYEFKSNDDFVEQCAQHVQPVQWIELPRVRELKAQFIEQADSRLYDGVRDDKTIKDTLLNFMEEPFQAFLTPRIWDQLQALRAKVLASPFPRRERPKAQPPLTIDDFKAIEVGARIEHSLDGPEWALAIKEITDREGSVVSCRVCEVHIPTISASADEKQLMLSEDDDSAHSTLLNFTFHMPGMSSLNYYVPVQPLTRRAPDTKWFEREPALQLPEGHIILSCDKWNENEELQRTWITQVNTSELLRRMKRIDPVPDTDFMRLEGRTAKDERIAYYCPLLSATGLIATGGSTSSIPMLSVEMNSHVLPHSTLDSLGL